MVILCASCRARPPAFELARAPWQYAGVTQQAIQQFKYHRRWRIGRWIAKEMVATAASSLPLDEVSVVVPVPLHRVKRWVKGWDPTKDLAQAVARGLAKPHRPQALCRVRWTTTQTRLSWRQRARNVHQAFVARHRHLREQTVLLIDDVLTSGATANACAMALKRAGARQVWVLTAAHTPLPR
ncbi:MAG: ComF family protein [Candidatus Omnitrophica bacterium]|nr:ComF family protein [Candidatus Omnitrophota bacterium]